jgi:hypothetical protein
MLAETKLPDAEKMGVTRMYNTLTDQEEPRDPDYFIFEHYPRVAYASSKLHSRF